jgi:hypothetical protein
MLQLTATACGDKRAWWVYTVRRGLKNINTGSDEILLFDFGYPGTNCFSRDNIVNKARHAAIV